jgi:hypothetical protein
VRPQRRRVLVCTSKTHVETVVSLEWKVAAQQQKEDAAQRVDVCRLARLLAERLLRRPVLRGSEKRAHCSHGQRA